MRTFRIFLVGSFLSLLLFQSSAQGYKYHIKVVDETNQEALINANILSGNKVIVTDIDGMCHEIFPQDEISISYIGYETKKLVLKKQSELQIIGLIPSSSMLEMATISTSRHEVSLAETTVSLDILTPQLIENNSLVSMDGVLDKVPGVQMVGDQVNIRGGSGFSYGSGSRVMLLIDDIPALTMDAGYPNWNDIPLENIAQVEVLKGAASSLYGSAALNGIVNVRTSMPSTEPETKLSVAYTSYMSPKSDVQKWWDKAPSSVYLNFIDKRKLGKLDLVLNGNYYYIDSYNKDTEAYRGRLGFKTRYRLTDKWSITLDGMLNTAKSKDFFIWKNAEETYEPLEGAQSSRSIKRYQLDPGMQYISDQGYKHYWRNRISIIQNNNEDDKSNHSISYYTEYQLQKDIPYIDVNGVVGVTYSTVTSDSDLYGGDIFKFSNFAGFLQLDKKLFGRLNLSVGTRLESNNLVPIEGDKPSLAGTELVSRAGANYRLWKAGFLRASWGQGYRFPTIAERYIRTNVSALVIYPNENLKPEKGWTSEVGFKQGVKIGSWNGFIDVAGFYQKYKNMMEFAFVLTGTTFGFQSQNIGNTNISGFEIGLGSQSTIGKIPINILAGYTYLSPKYDNFKLAIQQASSVDYNILKYRSKHSLKIDVEAIINNIEIGLSMQNISPILAIDKGLEELPIVGDFAGIKAYREINNKTRQLLNLRVAYKWNSLKIGLLLNNMLNQAYTLRPGLMEAPRNITVKLGYKL